MYEWKGSIVVSRRFPRGVWKVVGYPSPLFVESIESLYFFEVCKLMCEGIVIGADHEEKEGRHNKDEDGKESEVDVLAGEARSIFTRRALDLAD